MSFFDILHLALRNLRQAKLRAALTTMGVIVGVAVIVTMVSFGLGLQRNMLARFQALDLFNEINVFGRSLTSLASTGFDRTRTDSEERRGPRSRPDKDPTRILDDQAISEIAQIPGVAYVEPSINLQVYMRSNGQVATSNAAAASVPNASSRFAEFAAGRMIASPSVDEAVVSERFLRRFGYEKPVDAIGQTVDFLVPPEETKQVKKAEENAGNADEETPSNFFGLPLEIDRGPATKGSALTGRSFQIVGVLRTEITEGPGQGGFRGLLPPASVYIPLPAARQWSLNID